ncbi:hypothetical protein ACWCWD_02535 [Streptomyces sp. NPDC001493]
MIARAHRPRGRTVRARFQVRESPGVTVTSTGDGAGGGEGDGRDGDRRDGGGDGDGWSGDSRSGDGRSGDSRSGDSRSGDGRSGDGRSGDGRDTLFDAARRAAERALVEEGRGYLGGHLELRTPGGLRGPRGARGPRSLHHAVGRAAALAVTAALRGDDTGVTVRAPRCPA